MAHPICWACKPHRIPYHRVLWVLSLAALLVDQVLDDAWCCSSIHAALAALDSRTELNGVGVLDPACGSGTFLYFSAQRLLRSPLLADHSAPRKAAIVARLVNGIDVHPVAAEISRATLLRALPAEPPDGKSSIRIYEGDSLLVNSDDESSLFYPRNGEIRISTPRGGEILLPRSFIEQPAFADNLRRLVNAAANHLPLPDDIAHSVPHPDRAAMEACHASFINIIDREGNSVWTWYICNTTGPLRLREQKVNRIVANPPWVSMAEIQVENRKRALEDFADRDMELWTGGRDAPHFDIAQLFVKRTRELYLADPSSNPSAWIVKKSALRGGGWTRFRQWHQPLLAQSFDLEAVQPFGSGDARRCCVLFDTRRSQNLSRNNSSRIVVTAPQGRPTSDMGLEEALQLLTFRRAPKSLPSRPSSFLDESHTPLFRQGATITPKVLSVIHQTRPGPGLGNRTVTTAPSKQKPWQTVPTNTGTVRRRWVRNLLTSNELFAFVVNPTLPQAIIPTTAHGTLDTAPERHSEFWQELDRIYQENRGQGRNTPNTLIERLDYHGGISVQLVPKRVHRRLVLHPTSGDIMRAARIPPGTVILQHTLHYFIAASAGEAAFLVALLNAPSLHRAYVDSRTSGRHFTNNPWRAIPIPRYDPTNPLHWELADLCARAETIASRYVDKTEGRLGQIATSKHIRDLLHQRGVFPQIDEAARQILPDHADP